MNPDPKPAAADMLIDVTRLIWRRWAGRHPTGIDRVALAYTQHYQSRSRAVIQYPRFRRILPAALSAQLFALLLDGRPHFRRLLILFALRYCLHLLIGVRAPRQYYLNVGHTGLNHPGHLTWVRKSGVKPIYFIHDLIPITHPQFCREGEREKHVARMTAMLRGAHGVIGNSQDTLTILAAFAKGEGIGMPPAIAAHLGTANMPNIGRADPATSAGPHKPYFVILSTIEGRKNHAMLIDIWAAMIAEDIPDIPHLIIIGQRGWRADDVILRLDHDTALKPYVTEFSNIDDAEIARLLIGARALLFPSYAEGYGMPLAEALMAGTPVIASDLPVFREIAGGVPEYLDPGDAAGWRDAILHYAAAPSPHRDAQYRRMAGLTLPRWPDHFRKIDGWLAEMRRSDTGKLA